MSTTSPRRKPQEGSVPHAGCHASSTDEPPGGTADATGACAAHAATCSRESRSAHAVPGGVRRGQQAAWPHRRDGLGKRAFAEEVRTRPRRGGNIGDHRLGRPRPLMQIGRFGHRPGHVEHRRQGGGGNGETGEGETCCDQQVQEREPRATSGHGCPTPHGHCTPPACTTRSPRERPRGDTSTQRRRQPSCPGARMPQRRRNLAPGAGCVPALCQRPCSSSQSAQESVESSSGPGPVGARPWPPLAKGSAPSRRDCRSVTRPVVARAQVRAWSCDRRWRARCAASWSVRASATLMVAVVTSGKTAVSTVASRPAAITASSSNDPRWAGDDGEGMPWIIARAAPGWTAHESEQNRTGPITPGQIGPGWPLPAVAGTATGRRSGGARDDGMCRYATRSTWTRYSTPSMAPSDARNGRAVTGTGVPFAPGPTSDASRRTASSRQA